MVHGYGSKNYISGGGGAIVAVLAGLILVLALCKRIGWAVFCATLATLVTLIDFIHLCEGLDYARRFYPGAYPGESWGIIAIGILTTVVALFVPEQSVTIGSAPRR
jgi:hypothetical protein